MSDQYVAEIRVFACNYAPKGWALCNGQLLAISQYTAVFSLLGTTYGGDGRTNFALPNLQGIAPMFYQQGPGLPDYVIGETGGSPTVTLQSAQMPAHNHGGSLTASAGSRRGNLATASDNTLAGNSSINLYDQPASGLMAAGSLTPNGGGGAHNNLQPYLVLNFCIALEGIFPPRP